MIVLYVILFIVLLRFYIITEQFCNLKELKKNDIKEPPIVSPYINDNDYIIYITKELDNYKNNLKKYFNSINNC
jgi:hypothetical protein